MENNKSNNNGMETLAKQVKEAKKMLFGDCSTESTEDKCIVLASGDEVKEYGFLHTWYVDGAAASFGRTKAGVRWEIIGVDSVTDMVEMPDHNDYEDGEQDEDYKAMVGFIHELEESVCDGELIMNPQDEMESYSRIW